MLYGCNELLVEEHYYVAAPCGCCLDLLIMQTISVLFDSELSECWLC